MITDILLFLVVVYGAVGFLYGLTILAGAFILKNRSGSLTRGVEEESGESMKDSERTSWAWVAAVSVASIVFWPFIAYLVKTQVN